MSDFIIDGRQSPRERLSLDNGWRFFMGDIAMPEIKGHGMSYHNAKAGSGWGAASPDFDDTEWRTVNLPHDWAVETPAEENNNLSQGFHKRGFGWYRRTFRLNEADHGKHLELNFDGVATFCTVWVNGVIAARNFCGYTSFAIDITPFAHYGDDLNTISVRVDADSQEGWWYEGAGIYRHVWLTKRSPVHIATDGVYANPVKDSSGSWSIPIEVTLESSAKSSENVTIISTLIDPRGEVAGTVQTTASVAPLHKAVAHMSIPVESPSLWSCESPTLYAVQTIVQKGSELLDALTTTAGFRTFHFDPELGFFLNDQPLKILGTCCHQDNAGVGVAVPDSIWEYRLRRLKDMGSNAYRCAHNAPAAEFLDAADRMGILVMDENRNFNTTDEYIRQLHWLVRRDRNHPSVILWSVFNEETCQGTEQGYEMVRRLSAVVKDLDTTRPVTAAQSAGSINPINASLAADVAGFNYQPWDFDRFHALHPEIPMTSSEDTSAVMTRGEYQTELTSRFVLASYDDEHQPWGGDHRPIWRGIATRPFVAGTFIWTGFDYRGEPQPLEWPSTGSSFGIMDQCGFPKSAFFIHQAQWIKDRPLLSLIPHWNWAGKEGQEIRVMAISNADEVELLVNGKSLGKKPIDPIDVTAEWQVVYEPGVLEAAGYKDGKLVSRFAVETTGQPVSLKLIADRNELNNDGKDTMPVTVQVVDSVGRVVPNAGPLAVFGVTPSGQIIGVANGDPICHEPDKSDRRSLYNGLAQVILQSVDGATEAITLLAKSEGLTSAAITIPVKSVAAPPSVPVEPSIALITGWRQSPARDISPDPDEQINETDMNSYAWIHAGSPQPLTGGRFSLIKTTFTPRAVVRANGGRLTFKDFIGKANVYINSKHVATKNDAAKATFGVDITPTCGELNVVVIVEGKQDELAGFGGIVTVTEK